jgi:putative transposase
VRGIERQPIFWDSIDHACFVERLGKLITDSGRSCYAWALMSNHSHLLLKTGDAPLSGLMRRLLSWYAQHSNRRHKRHGHLFQNRYKSFLCEEESYLLELVRYIHLNPIRAGIVRDMRELNGFAWTGHPVIMGKIVHGWQDRSYVLGMFGKRDGPARIGYSQFVSKGISQGRRPDLVGGGLIRSLGGWAALSDMRKDGLRVVSDERILGGSEFVESVLAQAGEAFEKRTMARLKGLDLDGLVHFAADHLGIERALISSSVKERTAARARGIVCFLATDRLGVKGVEIARKMNLTPCGVSKLAGRGARMPWLQKLKVACSMVKAPEDKQESLCQYLFFRDHCATFRWFLLLG